MPTLTASIARARKALGCMSGTRKDGAPVAAGGAPDPSTTPPAGNLTSEAFAGAGALPAKSGVPKRRRDLLAVGGASKSLGVSPAPLPDPGSVEFAMALVPLLGDTIPDPILTNYHGLDIVIDRPAGFVQTKLADDGTVAWTRTYSCNYGFLPGTCGGDDDELDVFLSGPMPDGAENDGEQVYWFVILDALGQFDEYKLVIAALSVDDARAIIAAHIPPQYVAPGVAVTTVAQIRALLGQEPIDREMALVEVCKALDGAEPHHTKSRMDGEVAGATNEPGGSTPKRSVRLLPATKSTGEEQYVLGVVLEPEVTDAQGEVYSADVIRESAFNWLADYRNTDLEHKVFINQSVRVVESYIAPMDLAIDGQAVTAGTWLVGLIVLDPSLWASIKRGEIRGYSMNGLSRKELIGGA